ncbi:hypothetical protein OXI21_07670 [Ignatzschineria sp. RMDPL8A]|uniref:hypothetical protein n=1 Tax=Ignatzschineria sp. RMDPL8A TaxID=2999236 RepID=UPI0016A837D7|nr:hypothetical protein [Ignatzschineria sp. RMDPL8A]MDG9730287.1 hypothetical protein [Ignatzschineria sp. RMDPL8A]NLD09792.1 hypothetical protein [Xanthomonadaceae bacterium]
MYQTHPLISIVILAKTPDLKRLKRTINSVTMQHYSNWECLIEAPFLLPDLEEAHQDQTNNPSEFDGFFDDPYFEALFDDPRFIFPSELLANRASNKESDKEDNKNTSTELILANPNASRFTKKASLFSFLEQFLGEYLIVLQSGDQLYPEYLESVGDFALTHHTSLTDAPFQCHPLGAYPEKLTETDAKAHNNAQDQPLFLPDYLARFESIPHLFPRLLLERHSLLKVWESYADQFRGGTDHSLQSAWEQFILLYSASDEVTFGLCSHSHSGSKNKILYSLDASISITPEEEFKSHLTGFENILFLQTHLSRNSARGKILHPIIASRLQTHAAVIIHYYWAHLFNRPLRLQIKTQLSPIWGNLISVIKQAKLPFTTRIKAWIINRLVR